MIEYQILALLPFLLMFFLLLRTDIKTYNVMMLTYFFTILTLFFFWRTSIENMFFSSLRGVFIGLEIFLIIFSILILFNILKETKRIEKIKKFLKSFSDDENIHIIFIGYILVLFFESIAGFGTPAAVCAPLLVHLGIRPLTAVIICLISDTFAVAFGAFGTPLVKGIGTMTTPETLIQVGAQLGLIIGIVSIVIPTFLLYIYSKLEKKPFNLMKYLPFTLFTGAVYGISLIFSSIYLPLEMPAVISSFITLIIVGSLLKLGIFSKKVNSSSSNKLDIFLSILPYLLIAILFSLKTFISIPEFSYTLTETISYTLSLKTPGIAIGIVAILFLFFYANHMKKKILKEAFSDGKMALYTLIFTLAFVQILIFSQFNERGIGSIPEIIASIFSNTGVFYVFFATFIGAFGAFVAGSVTVSNLIFTPLQQFAANLNSISESSVLVLQTLGASAGNMIAIHNIIAALAVVKVKTNFKEVFKILFWIVFFTCILFSLLVLVLLI